ncbi:MAG TPA: putative PEP-binding protein [Actinomycetota bacterium]|nr:putative PEP-binding protein [Actinomycetota bacterium]
MARATYRGVGASPGLAAGAARVVRADASREGPRAATPDEAAARVHDALDAAARDLEQLADRLRATGHGDEAEIVSVGALMAHDPALRSDAAALARDSRDPSAAVVEAADRYADAIGALGDPALSERAADVRQVGRRAAAHAAGARRGARRDGGTIVVADELGPADVSGAGHGDVAGAVAVRGGPSSHAAIVARGLRVPLVLGIDAAVLATADGTPVVVDGDSGDVVIAPDDDESARAWAAMDAARRERAALEAERGLPAVTLDGRSIELLANVGTRAEVAAALDAGAAGVGLLRTELSFLDARAWPSEDEHLAALEPVLELLAGAVATVRVLDFGGDKVPPFLPRLRERGARGLPELLDAPDALGAQVRAALRAGRRAALRVLVPMVRDVDELRRARAIVDEAALSVGVEAPPVGAMVELPEAAEVAGELASAGDFVSIGSNDLTQSVLGIGRASLGSRPALTAHPAVLAHVGRVVDAARAHGVDVSVCGEAAADPLVLPLLVGLGITSLSVSPGRLDDARAQVRRLSYERCRALADDAAGMRSVDEAWAAVESALSADPSNS